MTVRIYHSGISWPHEPKLLFSSVFPPGLTVFDFNAVQKFKPRQTGDVLQDEDQGVHPLLLFILVTDDILCAVVGCWIVNPSAFSQGLGIGFPSFFSVPFFNVTPNVLQLFTGQPPIIGLFHQVMFP